MKARLLVCVFTILGSVSIPVFLVAQSQERPPDRPLFDPSGRWELRASIWSQTGTRNGVPYMLNLDGSGSVAAIEVPTSRNYELREEINSINGKLDKLRRENDALYNSYRKGEIPLEEYRPAYNGISGVQKGLLDWKRELVEELSTNKQKERNHFWSLECSIDSMDDSRTCTLHRVEKSSADLGLLYERKKWFVCIGHDHFPGKSVQIRVDSRPFHRVVAKYGCFTSQQSRAIIAEMRGANRVRFRYMQWPSESWIDREVDSVNYGMAEAMELAAWVARSFLRGD